MNRELSPAHMQTDLQDVSVTLVANIKVRPFSLLVACSHCTIKLNFILEN